MTEIEKLKSQIEQKEMEAVIQNIYFWETEEQLKAEIRELKAENEVLHAQIKDITETYTNTLKNILKKKG